MSAATIIKNAFEFAQILNRASHQSVSQWNDHSIKNALDWADYCQELFRQIRGQAYEDDVNNQLSQMTVFLDPVSCLRLSVDSLGSAKTLLLESWMSNPTFQAFSQKKLVDLLQDNSDSAKVFEEVQQAFSESTWCMQVCTDLMNTLNSRSDTSSTQNFMSELQAKVLLKNLSSAIRNVNKMHRLENYLRAVYDKLSKTQEGWSILVHVFIVNVCNLTCDEGLMLDLVRHHFLKQIKQAIQVDISASLLWGVQTDVLVKASCASGQFFLTYLDALIALGESFSPQIDGTGIVIWRSQHGHTLRLLCLHFQRHLEPASSLSQDSKASVLAAIVERVKGTGFTVWKELVRHLLHLLEQGSHTH